MPGTVAENWNVFQFCSTCSGNVVVPDQRSSATMDVVSDPVGTDAIRIGFRLLTDDDLPLLHRWLNDDVVRWGGRRRHLGRGAPGGTRRLPLRRLRRTPPGPGRDDRPVGWIPVLVPATNPTWRGGWSRLRSASETAGIRLPGSASRSTVVRVWGDDRGVRRPCGLRLHPDRRGRIRSGPGQRAVVAGVAGAAGFRPWPHRPEGAWTLSSCGRTGPTGAGYGDGDVTAPERVDVPGRVVEYPHAHGPFPCRRSTGSSTTRRDAPEPRAPPSRPIVDDSQARGPSGSPAAPTTTVDPSALAIVKMPLGGLFRRDRRSRVAADREPARHELGDGEFVLTIDRNDDPIRCGGGFRSVGSSPCRVDPTPTGPEHLDRRDLAHP